MQRRSISLLSIRPLSRAARAATALVRPPRIASAHCDSANGPVAGPAQAALESGDVRLVLPFVKPAQEAELSAAFEQAREVRTAGGKARELADRYFAETAVRLHRQGEHASYTGLQEEGALAPALAAAERALESGSLAEVLQQLDREVRHGVEDRYHAVLAARQAEARAKTVEGARARVDAEFTFEKFVLGISEAATAAVHAEAEPAVAGHSH